MTNGSPSLRPVELLAPLTELTGLFTQPTGTFTSGLSADWSPAPPPDIATVVTGQVPLAGLSPARTPTSLAAPSGWTRTNNPPLNSHAFQSRRRPSRATRAQFYWGIHRLEATTASPNRHQIVPNLSPHHSLSALQSSRSRVPFRILRNPEQTDFSVGTGRNRGHVWIGTGGASHGLVHVLEDRHKLRI